jgi:hypothetical protein
MRRACSVQHTVKTRDLRLMFYQGTPQTLFCGVVVYYYSTYYKAVCEGGGGWWKTCWHAPQDHEHTPDPGEQCDIGTPCSRRWCAHGRSARTGRQDYARFWSRCDVAQCHPHAPRMHLAYALRCSSKLVKCPRKRSPITAQRSPITALLG